MLMNLYQTAALLALLVTAGCGLSSCSGATDDSETALAVELAYDKASIDADGESAVTFTVKQGGVDITAKATISYTYGEETKELAQAHFLHQCSRYIYFHGNLRRTKFQNPCFHHRQ